MGFFDLMGFVWILIHCLDGFHVFCFSLWEMDDDLRKSRNDGLCFVFLMWEMFFSSLMGNGWCQCPCLVGFRSSRRNTWALVEPARESREYDFAGFHGKAFWLVYTSSSSIILAQLKIQVQRKFLMMFCFFFCSLIHCLAAMLVYKVVSPFTIAKLVRLPL